MPSELRPGTVRKKELQAESLEEFLARMTVVWHERQARNAAAAAKHIEHVRASIARAKERDEEAFLQRRREAQRRYEERHPERVEAAKARERVRTAKRSEERRVAREQKRLAKEAAERAKPPRHELRRLEEAVRVVDAARPVRSTWCPA